MYRYTISQPDALVLNPQWREAVSKAKLKRIECSFSGSVISADDTRNKANILAEMSNNGQVIVGSVHIPFGGRWNIAELDEEMRRAAVSFVIDFLNACQPLTCKNFTLHASAEPITDEDRPKAIASFHKSIDALLPLAQALDISLNVEILPRSCLGRTAEELKEILKDYPIENIGVCFDVNHLCGHPEMLPESIMLLKDRVRSLHISDYDGIDECHWYPGLGVIDWAAVMETVKQLPNDVVLIFESSGFLATPAWQKRGKAPEIDFNAAVRNIFYLENAAELTQRMKEMEIK